MKKIGALFHVPLPQSNPDWQEGLAGHLRRSLPIASPMGHLSLVEHMCRWDLPFAHCMDSGNVMSGSGEGTSGRKSDAAGQDGRNLSEEHCALVLPGTRRDKR